MDQAPILNMEGAAVIDPEGDKIGTVEQIYLDDETGRPEWVTVRTGFFGLRSSLVPLQGAAIEGSEVIVPFDKDTVKGAPNVDADDRLTQQAERELYEYYGMQYTPWSGQQGNAADLRLRRYVVARELGDDSRI
jgi:sporulation protein YlmC with PRC-barrel domain